MAHVLHAPLLLLTTLPVTMNLRLKPVLGELLLSDIEESSMEEEGAKEALEYAVRKYNEESKELYLSSVVDVKRVRTQVVGGENFFFDVILGQTTCTKTQDDLTNCPLNDQADQQEMKLCSFEVYVVPWEKQMCLTTSSCHKVQDPAKQYCADCTPLFPSSSPS